MDGYGTRVLVDGDNLEVGAFATHVRQEPNSVTRWITDAEQALDALGQAEDAFDQGFELWLGAYKLPDDSHRL